MSVASSNGPSTSVFWLGIGDIAFGRHVAPVTFISFNLFRALVCTSPMVFSFRSCFVGCLVGVRPGPLLLGLGPGSRGVGRVRAADCPACDGGPRSVTLAFCHPVTLLARVGWVRILFAFVS